jgi:hypothetical protein
MDAQALTFALGFNDRVVQLNLDGLTHDDSLVQPPGGGNCINWQLGHIVRHRNLMLQAIGAPTVWTDQAQARYDRGSESLAPGDPGVVALDDLRREFDRAGEQLRAALESASPESLDAPMGKATVGRRLLFLAMHEAYHVGQIGLGRRIAGKPGAIR